MLNERIKELRTAMNISQVELGDMLGVSKQSVSNWENDNILPSVDMLMKIAKFFRVSCDYLLGMTSDKTINVSELSDEEIAHICLLINDLSKK